jgi:hypothetical protein
MNPLDELKTSRVDRTPPWDGAARAMEAGRRRRFRRAAAIAGTALIVAGAAAGIGAGIGSGGEGSFDVAASAPALASVDGVDVTWLPAGWQPGNVQPGSRNYPKLGPVSFYQEFHDPKRPAPSVSYSPKPDAIGLALAVSRTTPVDFTAAAHDPIFALAYSYKPSWTTVQGQRALLMARSADQVGPAAFKLLWADKSGVVLEVDAFQGATLEQAKRLAASVVVHDSPTSPGQTQAAVADIRSAFKQAYTAPNPAPVALAAVEEGTSIAPTLEKLRRLMPNAVNTSRVRTGAIRFLGPTEAIVEADVSYAFLNTSATNSFPQTAKLVAGKWKVSRASFCNTITTNGVACPASFLRS